MTYIRSIPWFNAFFPYFVKNINSCSHFPAFLVFLECRPEADFWVRNNDPWNEGGLIGGYYNTRTDQENSMFHPVAAGIADCNLKIYSKAGMLVFESNEIELGWRLEGQTMRSRSLSVWKVRSTCRNRQTFFMAWDTMLLKYWFLVCCRRFVNILPIMGKMLIDFDVTFRKFGRIISYFV